MVHKFVPGTDSELWIAAIDADTLLPEEVTIAMSAAASIGATTLAVDATTVKLYKGHILKFGSNYAKLTADAASGVTSLAVRPLKAAIGATDEATTYAYLPVHSARQADFEKQAANEAANSFDTDAWDENFTLGRNAKLAVSGFLDNEDPAFTLLDSLSDDTGYSAMAYFLFLNNFTKKGRKGLFSVGNFSTPTNNRGLIQVNFDLMGVGKPDKETYVF